MNSRTQGSRARALGFSFALLGAYLVALGVAAIGLERIVFSGPSSAALVATLTYFRMGATVTVIVGVCVILLAVALMRRRSWARKALEGFLWLSIISIPTLNVAVTWLLLRRGAIAWVMGAIALGVLVVVTLIFMLRQLRSISLREELELHG